MLIISVLAGIVSPMVINSIERARESALKEDLHVMRKVLDDYYSDTGQYPESLQYLVDEGYIRAIPQNPFTKNSESWNTTLDEDGGISDIHSSYDEVSRDGSYYSEW